jgi:short-subunit dehydrogenase
MFTDTNWKKEEEMIQYYNINPIHQALKRFFKKKVIMNVASTAAFQPGPTMAVYYATKAYVLHFRGN